jgi:hypothetical protein
MTSAVLEMQTFLDALRKLDRIVDYKIVSLADGTLEAEIVPVPVLDKIKLELSDDDAR